MKVLRSGVSIAALLALTACGARVGDAPTDAAVDHRAVEASSFADAGFVCDPPADASTPPIAFSGTLFDPTGGCLAGAAVTLPVCGCFHGTGKDTSTWCFASPDGTAYFALTDDQCAVEMPAGWYATQTFGPSPFGTPNAAQTAACDAVAAASTVRKAPYDRPTPPACAPDGGLADAGRCVFDAQGGSSALDGWCDGGNGTDAPYDSGSQCLGVMEKCSEDGGLPCCPSYICSGSSICIKPGK